MTSRITREVVEGFLECPLKGHLEMIGHEGSEPEYAAMLAGLRRDVVLAATGKILAQPSTERVAQGISLTPAALKQGASFVLEGEFDNGLLSLRFDGLQLVAGRSKLGTFHYVPVLFHESSRVKREQKLLLALHGAVLADLQGKSPDYGIIWHGAECRATRVRLKGYVRSAEQLLESLRQLQTDGLAPPLVLNPHCPACKFRQRCFSQAIKDDNLSLVRGIGAKEIKKYARKGIFTLSQLSHTFRPRRKGKRTDGGNQKRHHSLQAMAIRDATVYVLGTPELRTSPVQIYFDIEASPEDRFVYLIGMIVVDGGLEQRFSFWADSKTEERAIFEQFLTVLSQYDDFLLFSYGSYETTFLKRMRKQDGLREQADRSLNALVNTLSIIYAHVYFPTYANGLKDVAACLGYAWSDPEASGLQSISWRAKWEASHDDALRQKLLQYNLEDCAALKLVTDCVYALFADPASSPPISLPVAGQRVARIQETDAHARARKWGEVQFVYPDYAYINGCAYFNYQRQKVYVQTSRTLRKNRARPTGYRNRRLKVTRRVEIQASECECCRGNDVAPLPKPPVGRRGPKVKRAFDLVASTGGVRLDVIECRSKLYRCNTCGAVFVPHRYERLARYFHGVKSWAMYQHIAHGASFGTIKEMIDVFFGLPVPKPELHRFKAEMARHYEATSHRLWERLLAGHLLHADETQIRLKGGKTAYVWVFTNLEEVAFMFRPNREGEFLRELLKDFRGVLVSDFYAAYDSLDCPQQKCLVHLIRDMNDDLLANPFDDDLQALTKPFGALLRSIVAAIGEHGLRKWYLRRFKRDVTAFFELVASLSPRSDVAQALRDRLLKNQNKLFTFLDYDGVPWNNNNAENAIKRFAYYRAHASGMMKDSGVTNFLTLLSICQTCKYKGVNFWRFLSSREESIDSFAAKKRRRRSLPLDIYPDWYRSNWERFSQSKACQPAPQADHVGRSRKSGDSDSA